MSKNNIVISVVVLLFIFLFWFIFVSYKNIQEKKQSQKNITIWESEENKELTSELEKMEVQPIIQLWDDSLSEEVNQNEESSESSINTSIDIATVSQSQKAPPIKTMQDYIDEENIKILSFSNIRQCNTLKYVKEKCIDQFTFQLAVKENKIDYCDKISDVIDKGNCIDEINYNLKKCELIKNAYLKEKCVYNLNEEKKITTSVTVVSSSNSWVSDCQKLSTYSQKEQCSKKIILENKDISICNKVFSNSEEQKKCRDNISYDFDRMIINEAFDKKNLSLCDKLVNTEAKSQCKQMQF